MKAKILVRFVVFVILVTLSLPFQLLGFLVAFIGHGYNIGVKHYAYLFGALDPRHDRK